MNKKTEAEIQRIKNSILANKIIAEGHPELKEKMEAQTKELNQRLEELKKAPISIKKSIKKIEIKPGEDLGWNCLAIQNNGQPCKCARKYGNYCKRHLEHYVIEKEGDLNDRA